jgi:hypothetical protein
LSPAPQTLLLGINSGFTSGGIESCRVKIRDTAEDTRYANQEVRNSNLLFLPDLHSLNLLKGQLIPGSTINPGGRWTRISGDPLRDLDGAARIHVLGNPRRSKAVTTNSL